MRKIVSLLFLLGALAVSVSSSAKILRVGYSGPAVAGVDFTNTQSAVNAATAGDTIQLYQNATVGGANVNKQLVFVGFGYFLENGGLQAVTSAPNAVSSLYLNAGSENTILQGIYFNDLRIGANNITVSRCLGQLYLGFTANGNVALSNVTIKSSYVNIDGSRGSIGNALISNCILTNIYLPNVSGLVSNNIFISGNAAFCSCIVKNNIIATTGLCVSGTSAIYTNNLFARSDNCGIAITGTNNQFNVNMTNVFVNWNNGNFGSESNLVLKAGSPAIGFGIDGNGNPTDAGIYGGEPGLVYKPSGIPPIPSIYQLSAPQLNTSSNPYTITISVKSNN